MAEFPPPLEEPTPLGMRLFDTIWHRRPIRYTLMAVVVVALLAAMYEAQSVTPTRTATRFDLEVSGHGDRAIVGVDRPNGEIHITGGRAGLSTLHVVDGSMFVLTEEVGADTTATWVHIPRSSIDPFPPALIPARVGEALAVGVKDCMPLTSDTEWWMGVLFGPASSSVERKCGHAFRNTSEPGTELIVDHSDRRPSDLEQAPTESITELVDVGNQAQVLTKLAELLAP